MTGTSTQNHIHLIKAKNMYKSLTLDTVFEPYFYQTNEVRDVKYASAIKHAIYNNEFLVHYQPRYDTYTHDIIIVEALVRWQRKNNKLLQPDNFIEVAINNDLIDKIDLWVFNQCCKDLPQLQKKFGPKIKIAVNITPVECVNLHHSKRLITICQSHNISFSNFEFEITESSHISDVSQIQNFCHTLKKFGATFSLDDFGTCFSPLQNLCELPVSYIKLDKSFVQKATHRSRSRILISHLIKLAHEMNIKVVAEGIENENQKNALIDMQCDQLQGFYLCKPQNLQAILST